MSLVINTNVSALNAQRQLVSSGNDMQQAMERLSSGRRINSAGDDAAGLAISNRQTSQIRGLNQAIRNASDGVSLIQTAEGALDETTNIMQRMRELSIQAANGIYSDADRSTLDAEFQQLLDELDRIAETTNFNGQNLLDGSLGNVELQVGAEANQVIDFSITAVTTSELGLGAVTSDLNGSTITAGANIGEGDVLINNQALSAITNLGGSAPTDTKFDDVIQDINDNISGVTATGYNIIQADGSGSGVLTDTETLRLTLGATDDQAAVIYDISSTDSMEDLVATINQVTGGNITADVNDAGRLTLSNATGGTITVSADVDNEQATGGGASTVFDVTTGGASDTLIQSVLGIDTGGTAGTKDYTGSIALTSDDGDTITITRGADGTDEDLEALGFPSVIGAGEVLGKALDSTDQNLALVSNDLKINGVNIGSIDADEGLQAKVDAINTVSDETGVTASIVARDAFTTSPSDTFTELTFDAFGFTAGQTALINGVSVVMDGTAAEAAININASSDTTGVSAFVDGGGQLHMFSQGQITLTSGTGAVTTLGNVSTAGAFTPTGVVSGTTYVAEALTDAGSVGINGTVVPLSDLSSLDTIINDINGVSGSTGVRAQVDDNGQLELVSSSRINIQLGTSDNGLASLAVLGVELTPELVTDNDLTNDVFVIDPAINLNSANDVPISIEVTANGTDATGLQSLNTDLSSSVTGSALASLSISTTEGASAAIDSIDQALETVNAIRSDLGAINNRLDFTMSNLSNITENTAAARSRIVDADFAAESANLSRAQVLQQASQAMLAQANAQPQQVLQLLQG